MGAIKKQLGGYKPNLNLCSDLTWQQYRLNDTDDHINRYLQFCRKVICNNSCNFSGMRTLYPKLTLASGSVLNIQAGQGIESTPDTNNPIKYTHIEVYSVLIAPNTRIPSSWSKYLDKTWTGKYARFCQIPVEIVNKYIDNNGGIILL